MTIDIVTMGDLIEAVRDSLPQRGIIAAGVFGSKPREIIPGKDLDVAIVLEHEHKDEALDALDSNFARIHSIRSDIRHSFYRGYNKSPDAFLIHGTIYTNTSDAQQECSIHRERSDVLATLLQQYAALAGTTTVFHGITGHTDPAETEYWLTKHRRQLEEHGTLSMRQWERTSSGWELIRQPRTPSPWERETLLARMRELEARHERRKQ